MPISDQGITHDRYMLIPRVAIFLRRGDSYLLIKGAPTKRLWAGKYNCVGGHVERGEDISMAAKRELQEETGLSADLWLCGTVIVDAGDAHAGVCLYVLSGECSDGEPVPSAEGVAEWVAYAHVDQLEVVEDLPVLLSRIHHMKRGDLPFSGRSHYDEKDHLVVNFADG
jgi:8-oxo-dGTP diphosphatase